MTLLETLRKKLDATTMTTIEDALGDDFDWDFVPRARLNKVIGERNDLRAKIKAAAGSQDHVDEDDDEASTGKKSDPDDKSNKTSLEELKSLKEQHKRELENVTKRYALLDKLREDGAKNPKLVLSQLDLEKITVKEDGTIDGYDDQLKPWKESSPYLFNEPSDKKDDKDDTPGGTGKTGTTDEEDEIDPFEAVISEYQTKK